MMISQDVHVRWVIRRDMQEVLDIEAECFDEPWSEDVFIQLLRQRNTIGMVAEMDGKIAGYMIYDLYKNRLHLLNFAVRADVQRCGVGSAMVRKLVKKLSPEAGRRNRIVLEVREANLNAQLFFKSCGFRCVSILKDFFSDSDEDAYLMQFRYLDSFLSD